MRLILGRYHGQGWIVSVSVTSCVFWVVQKEGSSAVACARVMLGCWAGIYMACRCHLLCRTWAEMQRLRRSHTSPWNMQVYRTFGLKVVVECWKCRFPVWVRGDQSMFARENRAG